MTRHIRITLSLDDPRATDDVGEVVGERCPGDRVEVARRATNGVTEVRVTPVGRWASEEDYDAALDACGTAEDWIASWIDDAVIAASNPQARINR